MQRILTFLLLGTFFVTLSGCTASRGAATAKEVTFTEEEKSWLAEPPKTAFDGELFQITEVSDDKTYGYSEKNPIRVGGGFNGGAANQRRFLRSIYGPEGQELTFSRDGSCCGFKTPHGVFNNGALLDIYSVTWEGQDEPVKLYIDLYDYAPLMAPQGFSLSKSSRL